jgi:glycerol transport system ATP-binding protein
VRRVEDVGRHKIVRCDYFGTEINAIAGEDDRIDGDQTRLVFDPAGINVYEDDWRVEGEPAREAA